MNINGLGSEKKAYSIHATSGMDMDSLIKAIRHTNLLAMALESKGFSPESKRSLYYEPRMGAADYIILFGLMVLLAVLIYLRLALHLGAIIPGRL